mmetsp:Transcript_14013/g.45729  ORF Transcript_14013/g.45729 Transcript_14013/m.45729 type:complete len:397 (-) Transcript_14013:60-1250(-)
MVVGLEGAFEGLFEGRVREGKAQDVAEGAVRGVGDVEDGPYSLEHDDFVVGVAAVVGIDQRSVRGVVRLEDDAAAGFRVGVVGNADDDVSVGQGVEAGDLFRGGPGERRAVQEDDVDVGDAALPFEAEGARIVGVEVDPGGRRREAARQQALVRLEKRQEDQRQEVRRQVLADARQVDDGVRAGGFQLRRGAEAGNQQELRRELRAGAHDHLATRGDVRFLLRRSVDDGDPDDARGHLRRIEVLQPQGARIDEDLQVRQRADLVRQEDRRRREAPSGLAAHRPRAAGTKGRLRGVRQRPVTLLQGNLLQAELVASRGGGPGPRRRRHQRRFPRAQFRFELLPLGREVFRCPVASPLVVDHVRACSQPASQPRGPIFGGDTDGSDEDNNKTKKRLST